MDQSPQQPDSLRGELRDAEAELRRRLREACEAEAGGVSTESADEIRRLEDTLLAAAAAAKQTLELRDRMGDRAPEAPRAAREQARSRESGARRAESARPPGHERESPRTSSVREFRDESGQQWRAWLVTPGVSGVRRSASRYLGEFQQGWVCFEGLGRSARRRLPGHPERWAELTDAELEELLQRAITVPDRRGESDASTSSQSEHSPA